MPELTLTVAVTLTEQQQRAIAYLSDRQRRWPSRAHATTCLQGAIATRLDQVVELARALGADVG